MKKLLKLSADRFLKASLADDWLSYLQRTGLFSIESLADFSEETGQEIEKKILIFIPRKFGAEINTDLLDCKNNSHYGFQSCYEAFKSLTNKQQKIIEGFIVSF